MARREEGSIGTSGEQREALTLIEAAHGQSPVSAGCIAYIAYMLSFARLVASCSPSLHLCSSCGLFPGYAFSAAPLCTTGELSAVFFWYNVQVRQHWISTPWNSH